jgi:hypothetical protein
VNGRARTAEADRLDVLTGADDLAGARFAEQARTLDGTPLATATDIADDADRVSLTRDRAIVVALVDPPRWAHAAEVTNRTPYPLDATAVVRSNRDGTRVTVVVAVQLGAEPTAARLRRLAGALHLEVGRLPPAQAERLASIVGGLGDLAAEVRS